MERAHIGNPPLSACRTTITPTLSARLNQSHEDNHLLSQRHLRRFNTDMEFRDSFSKLKKKVKHRLTGSKPKSNSTRADVGGENVESTGSRLESGPRVVAGGGHNQEGKEPSTDGGQVLSPIRLPPPDEPGPAPACGSVNDQERRGADIDRREVEQTHSHLHSVDVEVTEGRGPVEGKDNDREKVEQLDPSSPILQEGKPDST